MSPTQTAEIQANTDRQSKSGERIKSITQNIVEIVSDSGEGAQTAGQLFGSISARMGNGVWVVEIIPAEIEPPARSAAGASGNRIRIGSDPVSNMGDVADVVVAFNEQVPYSRIDVGAFAEGTVIFLENKWAEAAQESIREQYTTALADFEARGYEVFEIPMETECLKLVSDPRRGKNMWVLGLLCGFYERDMEIARKLVSDRFSSKGEAIANNNLNLIQAGYEWAKENLPYRCRLEGKTVPVPMLTMNGNTAIGLGAMAAGMEMCSMYPITPATSASHFLAEVFESVGGFVHQAEDEIAAINFALGASYAGKTALTITSGPGLALKMESLGLAVMAEIPLVIVDVQRGGPSTGLPTRVEQSDLLASLYGSPGDAPKIVIAPSSIEECFHFMITARQLAETFRGPVIVLSDASLATGVEVFPRPELTDEWLSPPIDQSPWDPAVKPYAWDAKTGLSQRPIPGQKDGRYVLTGLTHTEGSHIAYESAANQRGSDARSRKLVTFSQTLKPPEINGEPEGDLLVVGWGSTRGAINEAVDRVRLDGGKVSTIHLRFVSPLEPGLKEIFSHFKSVMTVEINFTDIPDAGQDLEGHRRYSQLAWLLRAQTLCDVDCFSRVPGVPLAPQGIEQELRLRLKKLSEVS